VGVRVFGKKSNAIDESAFGSFAKLTHKTLNAVVQDCRVNQARIAEFKVVPIMSFVFEGFAFPINQLRNKRCFC
jgi:hypothetical protein